jgi:uncharacterized membrane protein YphA (DoxX/SURF4 family)
MHDQHLNKTTNQEREFTMKNIMRWLSQPPVDGPESTVLLRVMAGGVFFWEGILKFVYVNQGVGRFTKLGMPFPIFTADFVGSLEIVGGLLVMAGLLTRWIAIPFVIEMIVAMLSTKISLYLGTSPLPLPPAPPKIGIWAVLHEIRSEYAQIMVVLYLLINGPGKWSLDALLARVRATEASIFSRRTALPGPMPVSGLTG